MTHASQLARTVLNDLCFLGGRFWPCGCGCHRRFRSPIATRSSQSQRSAAIDGPWLRMIPRAVCGLRAATECATTHPRPAPADDQRKATAPSRPFRARSAPAAPRRRPPRTNKTKHGVPPDWLSEIAWRRWRAADDQVHMRRMRTRMSIELCKAFAGIAAAGATGQAQDSNSSTISSGMNRVRSVYMCRSPLARCEWAKERTLRK